MTQPYRHWTVKPHGTLKQLDENMLTVEGKVRMPLGSFPRRMTVIRLRDRRLVIWSAIALDEYQMMRLDAFGRAAFLVVPNDHHRLDARAWKERYPHLRVVAPAGARARIEQVVPVDTTSPDFGDNSVHFMVVPGTLQREAALVVRNASGTTLVLNDVIGNLRTTRSLTGWLLRLAGFAGRSAQIPRVVKLKMVEDEQSLREQLLRWAETKSLKRILVSHGDPIEANPRQTLRELAGSLT